MTELVPLVFRRFVGWFCPVCRTTTNFGVERPRFQLAWCYQHGPEQGTEMDCLFVDNRTGALIP